LLSPATAIAQAVVSGRRGCAFLVHAVLNAFFCDATHFSLDAFSRDKSMRAHTSARKRRHAILSRSCGPLFSQLRSRDIAPRSSIVA
jgi:hypothetical protein